MGRRRGAATGGAELSERSAQIKLIVNADDLGWSEGVNEGIFLAHREGIVTSATLTANMPAAEGAIGQFRSHPRLGVGVHLNVAQGPALSPRGREVLAGPGGMMNATGVQVIRRCLFSRRRTLAAIQAEFDAQVDWCLRRGLRPTHLDTHRHVHAWPAIFRLVVETCGRYDIPFLRWHGTAGEPAPAGLKQRWVSRALRRLARRCQSIAPERIVTHGTLGVARTGRIDVPFLLAAVEALRGGATEILVHPGFAEDLPAEQTRLRGSRRIETEALCDPRVAERVAARKIALVHYGQLR